MTKGARYVYCIAVIAGLLLGVGAGYFITFTALHRSQEMNRTIAPVQFSEYAYMQYLRADAEHGKRALQELATLLEDMQRLQPNKRDEWSKAFGNYQADLGLTYTRLAILSEEAHDQAASDAYMAKAVIWYAASGRKQRSAEELKATLKEQDAKSKRAKTSATASRGG